MLRIQGLASTDLVGRPLHEVVPREQYEQLVPSYRAALEGEFSRIEHRSPGDDAEYEKTRRMLSRLGVDFAQGEHVGMPVALEQALGPALVA